VQPIKIWIAPLFLLLNFTGQNENTTIEMNTTDTKLGYLFWYFSLAISVASLIDNLYRFMF